MSFDVDLGTTDLLHSVCDVGQDLHRLAEQLAALDIVVPSGGRLQRHMRRIRSHLAENLPRDVTTATPLEFRRFQQALIDLSILRNALAMLRHQASWREHLRRALGGHEVPWQDTNHLARNTEFELYVASIFAAAGMKVWPGEPDILGEWKGWRVNLAVKRIQSRKTLGRRVHEAFHQIRRATRPGIVVVDASAACMNRAEFLQPNDEHAVLQHIQKRVTEVVTDLTGEQDVAFDPAYHLAILVIAFMPTILATGTDRPSQFCFFSHRHWIALMSPADVRSKQIAKLGLALGRVPVF